MTLTFLQCDQSSARAFPPRGRSMFVVGAKLNKSHNSALCDCIVEMKQLWPQETPKTILPRRKKETYSFSVISERKQPKQFSKFKRRERKKESRNDITTWKISQFFALFWSMATQITRRNSTFFAAIHSFFIGIKLLRARVSLLHKNCWSAFFSHLSCHISRVESTKLWKKKLVLETP